MCEYSKKLSLFKEEIKETTELMLKKLYKLPFEYQSLDKEEFENIFEEFIKINPLFVDYGNYYITTWFPYFYNGMLNYIYLTKEQRSNSYLENLIGE